MSGATASTSFFCTAYIQSHPVPMSLPILRQQCSKSVSLSI